MPEKTGEINDNQALAATQQFGKCEPWGPKGEGPVFTSVRLEQARTSSTCRANILILSCSALLATILDYVWNGWPPAAPLPVARRIECCTAMKLVLRRDNAAFQTD